MKLKNIKYDCTTIVDGKYIDTKWFVTWNAVSNYANRQFSKHGNLTSVIVKDFKTDKVITTYGA